MRTNTCWLLMAGTLSALACGGESALLAPETLDEYRAPLIAANGIRTNGIRTNGILIESIRVGTDGQLMAVAIDGTQIPAAAIPELLLESTLEDGTAADVRIDSAQFDAASGVYLYSLSQETKPGKWSPLCGTLNKTPILAVPLPGIYDPNTGSHTPSSDAFTFGCTNGALGKCALWGYKPWAQKTECINETCKPQSLLAWHVSCVRMVRADYCGDGVPHTRDGTSINVWDNLSVQLADPTSWEMEAEWTPSGARCIRHTRWKQADKKAKWADLEYVQRTCPERLASNQPGSCDVNTSDYLAQYGLHLDSFVRRLLRNQSQGNLTGTGQDKKGNRED